jgi:hypothetical protein
MAMRTLVRLRYPEGGKHGARDYSSVQSVLAEITKEKSRAEHVRRSDAVFYVADFV